VECFKVARDSVAEFRDFKVARDSVAEFRDFIVARDSVAEFRDFIVRQRTFCSKVGYSIAFGW